MKSWFYRIGQSDADRDMKSVTSLGVGIFLGWNQQQIDWYRLGFYTNYPKEKLQKLIEWNK